MGASVMFILALILLIPTLLILILAVIDPGSGGHFGGIFGLLAFFAVPVLGVPGLLFLFLSALRRGPRGD